MQVIIYAILLWTVLVPLTHAKILQVPRKIKTIQSAINNASPGDTILIMPGLYKENITLTSKNLTLASHFLKDRDTSHVMATVIDGDWRAPVISVMTIPEGTTYIIGLTIQNGREEKNLWRKSGGGINCLGSDLAVEHCVLIASSGVGLNCNASNVYIANSCLEQNESQGIRSVDSRVRINGCTIQDNGYIGDLCGVTCVNGEMTITRCMINHNQGRGVVCRNSETVIERTQISDNYGNNSGGIFCANKNELLVLNCTISGHTSGTYGGGIFASDSPALSVVNSLLFDNNPQEILFTHFRRGDQSAPVELVISHSSIENGTDEIVVNHEHHWSGQRINNNDGQFVKNVQILQGNISDNPLVLKNPDGEYHLVTGSPCIDAGTALFVWGNDTLVNLNENQYQGDAPDIGAFEAK